MENFVVENEEAGVEGGISSQKATDPVVYQLVRVDGNGILLPATDDEVMAVEDLLEDCKSEIKTPDAAQTLESSTDYGCGPCKSEDQAKYSEGQQQLEVLEVGVEKPYVSSHPAVDQDEKISLSIPNASDKNVCQSGSPDGCHKLPGGLDESQTSTSSIGPGLMPDFSLLNGEIHLECLSVRDLQETFRATFGRETSVKDKQWLKRRIIMGLTNSCDFSTTSFIIINNEVVKKGKQQTCKSAECSALVDYVSSPAIENHQNVTSFGDKPVEIHVVANETNSQSSSQHIHGSQDANMDQQPTKRIRKPTKRYIEELSEGEPRDSGAKSVFPVKQPSHDQSSATVCTRPVPKFTVDGRCLIRKDSLGGSGIQVPYVSRTRRSRPRENFMALMKLHPSGIGISNRLKEDDVASSELLENETGYEVLKNSSSPRWIQEPTGADSETCKVYVETRTIQLEKEVKNVESCKTDADDEGATVPTANGGMRRKHHRPWTLAEVVKLVEGVAKYGAGRWSEIKRLAFASYSYRTSVDLKDKWRNLLRASLSELATGNGANGSRKQTSIPIPAPILSRVRELANMHGQVPPSPSSMKVAAHPDSTDTVEEDARAGFL